VISTVRQTVENLFIHKVQTNRLSVSFWSKKSYARKTTMGPLDVLPTLGIEMVPAGCRRVSDSFHCWFGRLKTRDAHC